MSVARLQLWAAVALVAGAGALALWPDAARWRDAAPYVCFALAIGLWLVPAVRRGMTKRLEALHERRGRRAPWWPALLAGVATLGLTLVLAAWQGRELFPKVHDEQMYLVQARMLATGRLWMPPHELADFFDTYYVLQRPVYAAVYFPGTALLYLPWAWLDLPYWLMPSLVSAGVVTLLFRVVQQLIDEAAALLAPLLMLSAAAWRGMSTQVMSHTVVVLMALAMFLAWMRWLDRPRARWAAVAGLFAGWAAITRPLDAICYALPLVIVGVTAMRRMPTRTVIASIAAAVAAATPLLALQIIFNVGVTGHALQSPYQRYLETDQPGGGYGFSRPDAWAGPASALLQKRRYYHEFIAPAVAAHRGENIAGDLVRQRLPLVMSSTLPHPLIAILVPVGLIGLRDQRRWALWLSLPLFVLAYTFNPIMLPHYPVIYLPAVVLTLLMAVETLGRAWPNARGATITLLMLLVAAAAIGSLPGFNPRVHDHWYTPVMSDAELKLRSLPPDERAVVLFRYPATPLPGRDNVHEEPVYNFDSAWPDDQRVIRAHDLGGRDSEIVDYYARRQPDRVFWLYDRATLGITRLGTARELATRQAGAGR